jgi:pyruvate/2-oxoglutarate dehydrogenase complex dihydrolipoamide acyltransferase (E2) component
MAELEVTLPSLGDDAGDSAEVSFWYVDPGDTVAEGDSLLQMLTDKATFDVPSPAAGVVGEHRFAEGERVNVGDVICTLETSE